MRRSLVVALLAGLAMLLLAVPAHARHSSSPDTIPLPTGWQPEGIAIGHDKSVYVGSIPTGAIWRGDLRTGQGAPLVQAQEGRAAIGLKVDRRGRLWVAGGPTGKAFVYDAETGATLAEYQLAASTATFVNDVIVTRKAAWFTDSQQPVLYRVPIGRDGALAAQADVQTVQLTGDYVHQTGFNLNGIVASRDGRTLIVVQSNTGLLFNVSTRTGVTDQIELTGGDGNVVNGDGLLLKHRTLFVVQNQLNRIAVVKLDRGLDSGRIVTTLSDPRFDVPTTLAWSGKRLYTVNARFGVDAPETAAYDILAVSVPRGLLGHHGHHGHRHHGGCR
jgi:sugar lactone lactonase YvrE